MTIIRLTAAGVEGHLDVPVPEETERFLRSLCEPGTVEDPLRGWFYDAAAWALCQAGPEWLARAGMPAAASFHDLPVGATYGGGSVYIRAVRCELIKG